MNKKIRHIALSAAMLLASLAFVLTVVGGTASAHATRSAAPKVSNAVNLGNTMFRGGFFDLSDGGNDFMSSSSGEYELKFQPDGNLVEYNHWANNGIALWASHTTYPETCPGCGQGVIARMQSNGNFAIYDSQSHRVFATNTVPNGYKLMVDNGGEVIVYDQGNNILWRNF